ncbi:hypothetical protein AB6B31_06250 [Acinetobacter baumannii]
MEFKTYGEALDAIYDIQEPLREDIKNYVMKRIEEFEKETGLTMCKVQMYLTRGFPNGRHLNVETEVKMERSG